MAWLAGVQVYGVLCGLFAGNFPLVQAAGSMAAIFVIAGIFMAYDTFGDLRQAIRATMTVPWTVSRIRKICRLSRRRVGQTLDWIQRRLGAA